MPPDVLLTDPMLDTPADTDVGTPAVDQERVAGPECVRCGAAEAGGAAKPEALQWGVGSPRSRPRSATGQAPGISGSSGGSEDRSQEQSGLSGRKRGVPEPDLASMKDPEERRRQQRLAKTRATAAASRERKRLEAEQMGARAGALQQQNAHLKGLLVHKNQEKHLLARELEAAVHRGGQASLPRGASVPSAGVEPCLPQMGAARQRPPLHGHSSALRLSHAGPAPVPLHEWFSPFKGAAESIPEGRLPDQELRRLHSRPELAADSSSGGSQVTRVGSVPAQMSGLTGSPRRCTDRAKQLPGTERQERQLSDRLLPELDALIEADGCSELPGPGPPGPSHGLLLPPALVLQHPLSGPAGLDGGVDGWGGDEEADLALLSDLGQPIARGGLKSLPPEFQAPRQLGISPEGSTSLPAHLHRSSVAPGSESASPSPAPGPGMPFGPGIIVGVEGQWLRLKPGIPIPPAMRQRLGQPSAPSLPWTQPSWP